MGDREFKRRFTLETTKNNGKIEIKAYDSKLDQYFVYGENEIKNMPSQLSELKAFIRDNWKDIKKGKYG
ncbi:hypothetical protein J416_15477 [Gracilibacillus halophilus YIM-C55.5]|uniref:Uncharacterized protein n=1 Tax=Gracilibacillus halophilus YIM-C55.5 TaxID=1308866 RepID=N4W8P9_9BACI|nr:hypothetical protein [Gracilibacillus halophilus]ENH95564.1 hypothetical protein J416_15477 [Gracilibacillus halophilus YIM-C55.5]